RGVQTVGDRTLPGLRPIAGEDVVGATPKQQIETPSLRRGDRLSPGRASIWDGPSAMRVVVAALAPSAGRLDYAVQRDLFEDPDLPHCESPSLRDSARGRKSCSDAPTSGIRRPASRRAPNTTLSPPRAGHGFRLRRPSPP